MGLEARPPTATGGALWRLLPVAEGAAVEHLALTQALLEEIGAGRSPATVRCERWPVPALVLGTAQPAADVDLAACRARGIALARRLAGGTAVYATPGYLSFTIVARETDPLVHGDILATYRRLGAAVGAALLSLGIASRLLPVEEARARSTPPALKPFCYGGFSPYEALAGDRKLVGVAQVRRFGAIAYVGGLYHTFDPAEHAACIIGDPALRAERAALLAASVTDLAALGAPAAFERFPAALAAALVACRSVALQPGCLTAAERARAARLRTERYGRDDWTFRH